MEKIIVAGFGGQGVLSFGQLLAYAALDENKAATWLPSYGPEMRGGTASCSVCIDDVAVASPVIAVPDSLVVMNKPSFDKYIGGVKKGGRIFVNSSLIADKVEDTRTDCEVYYVDANAIAHEVGNDKASNLVVLGAYIKITGLYTKERMLETIAHAFAAKPQFIESNQACFIAGYNLY